MPFAVKPLRVPSLAKNARSARLIVRALGRRKCDMLCVYCAGADHLGSKESRNESPQTWHRFSRSGYNFQ